MLGLGTEAKCQSKSLKIEGMMVYGMWQITVTAAECITRETFLKEVKDSLIQEMVFLKFGLLSLYAMWRSNSSALLLA